jgi:hypothetical protein
LIDPPEDAEEIAGQWQASENLAVSGKSVEKERPENVGGSAEEASGGLAGMDD